MIRSCGNCKYFKDEDANGEGFCEVKYEFEGCYHECGNHEFRNNGWTEITPDNVDEVRETDVGRLMIAVTHRGKPEYMEYSEMFHNLDTMAELGGYYYYVLPELKIE